MSGAAGGAEVAAGWVEAIGSDEVGGVDTLTQPTRRTSGRSATRRGTLLGFNAAGVYMSHHAARLELAPISPHRIGPPRLTNERPDRVATIDSAEMRGLQVPTLIVAADADMAPPSHSRLVRIAARDVVGAKQREYDIFSASTLAWTALRPPLVIDGQPRGYLLSQRLTPGARVTRADVAQAVVDQLTDRTFVHAAPFVLTAS